LQPKFEIRTHITFGDYLQYHFIANRRTLIIKLILCLLIFFFLQSDAISPTRPTASTWFIFTCMMIFLCFSFYRQLKRNYEQQCRTGGSTFALAFYDDHVEQSSLHAEISLPYNKILRCIETGHSFYLLANATDAIFVNKRSCSDELIAFLRQLPMDYSVPEVPLPTPALLCTDNILYQTETHWTYEEYKKFVRHVNNKYTNILRLCIYLPLIIALWNHPPALQPDAILDILLKFKAQFLLIFLIEAYAHYPLRRAYNKDKTVCQTTVTCYFYPEHLRCLSPTGDVDRRYDQIEKIIETNTNFYLMFNKTHGHNIIKANCTPELIKFLHQMC